MIMLLILIIVALVAAGLAVNYLGAEAGYVLLSFNDYTVEMTLWTLMGLTVLALLLLWLLLQLVMMVFGVPGNWSNWRKNRRQKATSRLSNQGQMAYVEGNWQGAKQAFAQVPENEGAAQPLINYVLAARANDALGDTQGAKAALLEGEARVPKSALALGITEAELQVARGQLGQAQQSLQRVGAGSGSHPAALKLMAQIHEDKQEWSELHKLLPKLNKAGALDSAASLALERRVFCALLGQAGADKHALEHAWKQVPADLKHDPDIASVYAGKLMALGAGDRAEKFLREAASTNLPDNLVNLYGRVQGSDVRDQLATAEGWLKEHGQSAELYLCAGRLALASRKWTAARGHLENCLKRDQNPAAYAELGRLLSHTGEEEAGAECYRQGLLAACGGLPDIVMPTPPAKPVATQQHEQSTEKAVAVAETVSQSAPAAADSAAKE